MKNNVLFLFSVLGFFCLKGIQGPAAVEGFIPMSAPLTFGDFVSNELPYEEKCDTHYQSILNDNLEEDDFIPLPWEPLKASLARSSEEIFTGISFQEFFDKEAPEIDCQGMLDLSCLNITVIGQDFFDGYATESIKRINLDSNYIQYLPHRLDGNFLNVIEMNLSSNMIDDFNALSLFIKSHFINLQRLIVHRKDFDTKEQVLDFITTLSFMPEIIIVRGNDTESSDSDMM